MKVTLRLVGVELPGAVSPREPYVAAIPISANSTGRVPVIVAGRERESAPEPADGAPAAPVAAPAPATAPVRRVDLDVVLFDGDPGDWLMVHGVVHLSDKDYRRAGERIDNARHAIDGSGLAAGLEAGMAYANAAQSLVSDAAWRVSDLLTVGGDAWLFDFDLRLDGEDAYRAKAAADGGAFSVERGGWTLRFTLSLTVEAPEDEAPREDATSTLTAPPAPGSAPENPGQPVGPEGVGPAVDGNSTMTSAELVGVVNGLPAESSQTVDGVTVETKTIPDGAVVVDEVKPAAAGTPFLSAFTVVERTPDVIRETAPVEVRSEPEAPVETTARVARRRTGADA